MSWAYDPLLLFFIVVDEQFFVIDLDLELVDQLFTELGEGLLEVLVVHRGVSPGKEWKVLIDLFQWDLFNGP